MENLHRKYNLDPPRRVNHTIAPLKAWKYIFSNDIIKIIVDCANIKPFFKHQNAFQKLLPKKCVMVVKPNYNLKKCEMFYAFITLQWTNSAFLSLKMLFMCFKSPRSAQRIFDSTRIFIEICSASHKRKSWSKPYSIGKM